MEKTDELFLQAVSYGLKAQIMKDPRATEEEWEKILLQSVSQSLLPLVFEAVYPFLPEEMERRYRSIAINWITRQVKASDEFVETYKALREAGVEPLVIKGIICRNSYMLPDWRVSSDEDIYVRREDYIRLHTCLKQLGFRCKEPNFRSEHELVYNGNTLVVEGHWELFPQENNFWEEMNVLSEEIMKHAVHTEIEGVSVLMPDPTDHMIYLLLHSMKHFALSGVGIRQICDIVAWDSQYTIAWDKVRDTMNRIGGLTFAEAVLDAGNRYFEMPFPNGWERTDSTDLVLDSLSGGIFGHSSQDRIHSASITSADSVTGHNMVFNIFKSVFPSGTVMEINYPWISKSKLLLPVGWGIRLFRYARNIGKNKSPLNSIKIGAKRVEILRKYNIFEK